MDLKEFNASFETFFDSNLPFVKIIPQDIGRVVLNLINNAFYACAERSRNVAHEKSNEKEGEYKPLVTITTQQMSNKQLKISINDNGCGIPRDNLDKIFQPFFTTKPTGQGTGLGLSLSYDIVKAHGGELKVESVVGVKTEFCIILNVD